MPSWTVVSETMKTIANLVKNFDLKKKIVKSAPPEKLLEWKQKKFSTEMRWVEIFKHTDTSEVP